MKEKEIKALIEDAKENDGDYEDDDLIVLDYLLSMKKYEKHHGTLPDKGVK